MRGLLYGGLLENRKKDIKKGGHCARLFAVLNLVFRI